MTTRSPDDRAVRLFIDRSMIVRIATMSPRGNADIIPLWFIPRGGRIYMGTRGENPVVRDLRINPEVVLMFHGEKRKRRDHVLKVRGRATFITDTSGLRDLYVRAGLRYYAPPSSIWSSIRHLKLFPLQARYQRERATEPGFIEVIPESAEFLRIPGA